MSKTAHGLVRGTERYKILAVIDGPTAGRDAGEVLDGLARGIPIYATISDLLQASPVKPDYCIVGIATHGGKLEPGLRVLLLEAIRAGISVVNGLHEYAGDDPNLVQAAQETGVCITDIRRPKPKDQLHFWTGEIRTLSTPRIAVLGTDCSLGKRTTTRLLAQTCQENGIQAQWIYTGQTGWLQGAPVGFVLDSVTNDFVSGEVEHALLTCARRFDPEVIFIEGQSSLRNPSGPCGSEFIISGGAKGVILQHAPGRIYFSGYEQEGYRIPPLAEEIALIRLLGAQVLAVTLNSKGLGAEALQQAQTRLSQELNLPVVCPLEEGLSALLPVLRDFITRESQA
ncbi:DUF1611 domain-containing protein [Anthocerotibacter panamensis]|uniref:DUF1611 domain-containing protein n=1 Tax=Anthocerotibacter panamensis TaxID=2857077 RepID=UPI001C403591|nr:DUF1611 domain-containing protein [Anthocerotibacter panamensis]